MDNRYHLIKLVGRGAMGEVWLAEDNLLKRRVALKFLSLSPTLTEAEQSESVERFHREAQAAARLSHRNVVTIHDIGEIGGRHFISMEYLEGATLDQVIATGPRTAEQAAGTVAQVADALAYAHSQGVVHRDVKPENIFLLPDGTIKVTDFGIARVMGSSTMTQVGTVMGTPGYMSPEQVRGEHTDWRTDIFSTGVVLYELLTGVKAFDAESLTSVMYKVVHEPPPPLVSLRPDLDPWMIGVVERGTSKDPASRYQQASQLAQDLRSHSLSAAAPSTILVPGAGPAAAPREDTVLRAPGQAPPPSPEQASAPSRRRLSAPVLAVIIAACVLLLAGGVVTAVLLFSSSKVTVPDLDGVSYEKARSQLEKLGLAVDKSEMASDKYEDGEVFSQSPGAGQKVEAGSTVKLDVARAEAQEKPVEDHGAAITAVVNNLAAGRNAKDFPLFMSCYSLAFQSTANNNPSYRNLNYEAWQAAQAKYFNPPYSQTMTVEAPVINVARDGMSADVSFGSGYVLYINGAVNHQDHGTYVLKMQKEAAGWKIVSESWMEG